MPENVKSTKKTINILQKRRLLVEALENRQLMAVDTIVYGDGLLTLRSNNAPTHVELSLVGSNVRIAEGASVREMPAPGLSRIHFIGGSSNDYFRAFIPTLQQVIANGNGGDDTLHGSGLHDELYGGDGNDKLYGWGGKDKLFGGNGDDTLEGGGGHDLIYGELGNDIIKAGVGNDRVWAGAGNDRVFGGDGNDEIHGNDGNDYLYGEIGDDILIGGGGIDRIYGGDGDDHLSGQNDVDYLFGEAGDDVLIGIDGGVSDVLDGGTGRDIFWRDSSGGSSDQVVSVNSLDKVHSVSSFANGADRSINADRIADPAVTSSGISYRRFENIPLFSANGPSSDDALQGNLGDCYLIAGMSAVAMDSPHAIRHSIVDFRDGTYGVNLYGKYYRVDNDLPVFGVGSKNLQLAEPGDRPAYAQLGRNDDNAPKSMWVAIMEKAFAHARTGANSYASLDGGWAVEVNRALGSTTAGTRNIHSYSSGASLAMDLFNRYWDYQAVTIGFLGTNTTGAPLVMNHMYTVAGFEFDNSGAISGVVLRNPWGEDGVSNNSPLGDGLVVVTPQQLFGLSGAVNWGKVA